MPAVDLKFYSNSTQSSGIYSRQLIILLLPRDSALSCRSFFIVPLSALPSTLSESINPGSAVVRYPQLHEARTRSCPKGNSFSRAPSGFHFVAGHFLPVTRASHTEITRRDCLGIDRSLIIAAASFYASIFSVTQSSRPTAALRG